MPFLPRFARRGSALEAELLYRELLKTNAEIEAKDQIITAQLREQDRLKVAIAAKDNPAPLDLSELAPALREWVPTVIAAPGYAQLAKAHDAKTVASAIHSLMLTARAVGYQEGLNAK